jgi:hypothetical protein
LPYSAPLDEGKDLIVDIPVDATGTTDIYIDNTIAVSVD